MSHAPLTRLALFDCDGTLADSQFEIVSAMAEACAATGRVPFPTPAVRATIGLNVDRAVALLLPDADEETRDTLADAYRDAYLNARTLIGAAPEPLFDGIPTLLEQLRARGWALGIATGKSRRGLDRLLTAHGLAGHFATLQTADMHPSKPDPAMAHAAMAHCGVGGAATVVIGDTAFDMAMARSAGAHAIGVSWGYHDRATLLASGAVHVVDDAAELLTILEDLL